MRICSGKGNAMKDKQKEKEMFGLFGEMDLEEPNRRKMKKIRKKRPERSC